MATIAAPPSNMFRGVKSAKRTSDSEYLGKTGRYLLMIEKCKTDRSRKNTDFCAVEYKVIWVDPEKPNPRSHNIGDTVAHLFMCNSDYFFPDVKGFMCTALGLDDDSAVSEQEFEAACNSVFGPEQILTYNVLLADVDEIVTKKGNPFSKKRYRRTVSPAEVYRTCKPEFLARFFPPQWVQAAAAASAQPVVK